MHEQRAQAHEQSLSHARTAGSNDWPNSYQFLSFTLSLIHQREHRPLICVRCGPVVRVHGRSAPSYEGSMLRT